MSLDEAHYQLNVEKARLYENLLANEDFQKFKTEQFDEVMTAYIKVVMFETNVLSEQSVKEAIKYITKFQTLNYAFDDAFNQKIDAAAKARNELKKIRERKETTYGV